MNERGGDGIRERYRYVYRQKLRETDGRTERVTGLLERERPTYRLTDRRKYCQIDRRTDTETD